ncbi:eIF-2-alpha kinase GCN2-like [Mytilus trossulus]|uniref:eIF-2-alpha kinase GCN2-like n=1 Tax=Mytilus trossulus TaxID=6551 RepID=UPI003003CC38
MVLELAQHVQTFLRDNYKGPQKSFYEEMLSNQLKQQEKQKLEQQKRLDFLKRKEEKERQLLEDEIQKRQHALKEETKKIKETKQISDEKPTDQEKAVPATPNTEVPTCSPIGTPSTPRRPRMSHSPSPLIVLPSNENKYNQDKRRRRTSTPLRDTDDSDHQCKDHTGGIVVIAFNTKSERTIHRGTCLGHSVHGSTVYAGIDTASGELVAISEWVLKWRHIKQKRTQRVDYEDKEGATYLKQITSIEQEIHSLIRLRHKNLIHYLAIKYIQEAGKCTVYILMDYSGGASLNIHITESRPLSVDIIKAYTEEILYGLEYLHKKDVVHKYLRASSIVVDKNGRIRIGDYSIDKRLSDLYYAVESSRPGVHFSGDRELIPVRGGKKGDVYQLGLILLSVAIGLDADPDKPEIPQNFPPVFQDFLTKCLMKDERHRWSVYQLLDHSFIKEELPHTIHYAPHKPAATEENEKKQDVNKDNDSEDDDLADLPFITALEASGQSRLTNEFEVLRSLGKGGFGDVIEVRNKLDRRKYAIKRIPLNPKSKYFNKKITREVKLLSRLNHENVVRYYNSWIETSEDPALSDSSTSCSTTTGTGTTGKTQTTSDSSSLMKNSLNFTDDIEKFAPQARDVSVEWSMSYNTTGIQKIHNDSSDSEDEAEVFGTSFFGKMDTSDDVLFEHDSSDKSEDEEAGINKSNKNIEPEQVAKLQYLYIQMEFCERSTLRNCIDAGLYLDINRLWRFFREIVEGLVHIHEQGMIHRDLKPVNIFLDSNDHVKIGDFGLATTSVLASQPNIDATMFSLSALESREGVSKSMSRSDGAGDLTGKVGTALYVSPEMMTKMSYSQKVDMYSLGVIFFEMCYRPLTTGMERVQILANLRSMDIVFPEDFDQLEMKNQTGILKMLMNHDPSQRPTSAELLKSEYMPPPQLEEAEQNEILRSTISDPHSKAYKRLINELFSQTITSADDHLYDSDFHKGGITIKTALTNELVYENLIRIFQKHGAIPVLSPFFMPKSSVYDKSENYPCFMDHSGLLIGLPFDLRAPFARYIARNNITNLKRYCIGKVFRTKKLHKLHPRELTECAFDIVTSSQGSLIPDAEILIIVQEIINEFPALQSRSYYVKINHVTILRAVLMHSGIEDHLFDDVMTALSGPKVDSKTHTKSLNSLGLSEQVISSLLNFLEMEGPFSKISSFLRCITKTKGEAASLAKQGLHELETVINHAVSMGCKLQMIVSLGFLYSVHQYSGVIFQVMCDHRKKNRNIPDVLAVGGRFDDLISKFHSPITHSLSQQYSITQHAVGVSIHFEKIVSALVDYPEYQPSTRCDILVCAIGHKPMLKDRMTIIKDLWAAGLKAELLLETIQAQEDIQDICRSAGISHMVVIKDGDSIKVRSIDKDKIAEKKLTPNDPSLTEFLLQKIQSNKIEQNDTKSQLGVCNITFSQPHSETVQSQSNSSNMTLNFIFIMMEGKLALNTRKKYELQIHGKVTTSLSWLPGKTCDVVAVELNVSVIKTVAAYLELNGNQKDFNLSISSIIEKHPKHRKYLSNVFDQIFELKFERKTGNDKGCDFIVLYGLKDDSVKLLS